MAKAKISQGLRDRVMNQEETPRVSFRYFKVTEGPLIDELRAMSADKSLAFKEAMELGKSFGANEAVTYRGWMFGFDTAPNSAIWTVGLTHKGKTYYKPNRRSSEGRRFATAIKKLRYPRDHNDSISVLGLDLGPAVVEGNRWYRPVVWGWYDGPLFLVKVPWRAYAPEILEAYRSMKAAGEYSSGAMDHALWEPHTSMAEIKEWEALKIDAERKEAAA